MAEDMQSSARAVAETFPAAPDSVPRARQVVVAIATGAGATEQQVDAIRLATSEALTNAVVHAYDGAPGLIYVTAELVGDGLEVTVADDGRGLHPTVDRSGMGLGLSLIAEAVEEMEIVKRPSGGMAVRMRFALSPRS